MNGCRFCLCVFEMNSSPNTCLYPAQVYAQFTSSKRKSSSDVGQQNMTNQTTQLPPDLIQICESGEVTISPDLAKVHMICSSTKDSTEEVKTSVNKRVDYILQTFRSQNIAKDCYSIDRSLRRTDLKYNFSAEISVHFTDFTKCQEVTNFLVEKLGTSVEIDTPTFHYSPRKLESLRRQACVLAVHNAKVKALEITNSLNQTLGKARHIQEESTEEYTGSGKDITEHRDNGGTYQQLLKSATVTVVTKVSVCFELKGKTKNKK